MPSVKLVDTIEVEPFMMLEAEFDPRLTAFSQSGVVVNSPRFNQAANSPGEIVRMPFWRDLDMDIEPNYSTDSDNLSTPNKVIQGDMITRAAHVNNSWASKDLTAELAPGESPLRHVRNRIDRYWMNAWQTRVVAYTTGVLAANVAGNFHAQIAGDSAANDMVVDISGAAAGANVFSQQAFIDAAFTLGDHYSMLSAILCHSAIYKRMLQNNDIEFIIDSELNINIPTYLGHRVIVDDGSPMYNGNFVTTMFGSAMFAFGEGTPEVPFEIDREPAQGDGGGEEIVYSRKTWLLHAYGHTNLSAVASGPAVTGTYQPSQTLADLVDPNNHQRTHLRKNVPIAFLVTAS